MIGMAISTDIIAFFVSFELMSLPTYVLAGYIWRDEKSSEASLKYFVTGAFSSAILAFGLALLYAATGATSYAGIAAGLDGLASSGVAAGGFLVVAFVLVVTGFGFKVSAVPFHSWAPDVYEGAPTPVTAFMATAVKAAAFIGFAKLFIMAAGGNWADWGHVMIVLAVLTMVVGNVLALPQRNLKRMLAYSSIAHAGYLTLGLIAAGKSGDNLGVSAILFYLVAYALMNLGAFGVLIWIRARRKYDYSLDGLAGLGRTLPWPAILLALFMVSLTGIPPTVGFWGKFYLFTAVIQADLTWLAIIAVVMSAVSAFYYLRVVWYLYFREAVEGAVEEDEPASTQAGVIAAVAIAGSRRRARGPVPGAAARRGAGSGAGHHRRLSPPGRPHAVSSLAPLPLPAGAASGRGNEHAVVNRSANSSAPGAESCAASRLLKYAPSQAHREPSAGGASRPGEPATVQAPRCGRAGRCRAMRGDEERQAGFIVMTTLEDVVPADHPLRAIRAMVDAALEG